MSETPATPRPAAPSPRPDGPPPDASRVGFGPRLGAYLVDGVVLITVLVIVSQVLGSVPTFGGLILLVILVGYSIYFEGSPSGQTPGKKLLGIRVVDATNGGPIGYGRGGVRWLGKLVAGIPCYLGYFWVLWDAEKQAWQDKIATTVVVSVRDYPVEKWPG